MDHPKSVVVLGAGHGGVQAAASLRQEGYEGELVLLDAGSDLPYHKPPLSKAFIADRAFEPPVLKPEAFYAKERIDLRLGCRVTAIDLPARRLETADGSTIPYDRLVLAPGVRPRRLPAPGADLDGVLSLRERTDAAAIRDRGTAASAVVIVGGGFIGMEIAFTFAKLGKTVTVIEAGPRILSRAVSAEISAHVAALAIEAGIDLRLGTTVDAVEGIAGRAVAVRAAGGSIPADLVVTAVGVDAAFSPANTVGIGGPAGIPVDLSLATAVPGVYAIGDAVIFRHWLTGTDVRLESVQNATDQGKAVARTLVGRGEDYRTVPWFWSDLGSVKLQMAGLAAPADRRILRGDPASGSFSVFHFVGPDVVSVDSVNRPADHMLARRLIGSGVLLAPDLVADPASDLKAALVG